MTRGLARQAGIPSVRCTARTRRGTPCQQFAPTGQLVCRWHGGAAPQVVRKAEERVTFAQLLQGERRPLAEVLLDCVHTADAATQELRIEVASGEPVSVDRLDRLLELNRLTHHLARTAFDSGVAAKLVEQQRASLQEVGAVLSEVLLAVLHSLPLTPAWREYLLDVAHHQLQVIVRREGNQVFDRPTEPLGERPVPPTEPVLMSALSG